MNAKPPQTLSKDMVKALYGEPLSLSASQLESYNGCAFRYFLTYGLLLREREKAGIESRSKGSIQHGALYVYFTALKESGTDFNTIEKEDCFRAVGEAVEQEARKNAELLYESSAYYQYIVMQMKGIAARTAWEVVKFYQSSHFRPYGFEITIGKRGRIPALSVKTADGKEIANIRGIIDRADTAACGEETLVSIIDYKSSSKGLDVKLTEDGITLQPLLYAHALCQSMDKAVPAGMMYLKMTDPIITEDKAKNNPELAINKEMRPQGWLSDEAEVLEAYGSAGDKNTESYRPSGSAAMVSREELAKRIEKANAKILASAESIVGGNIGANPYQNYLHDACEYCQYHGICKIEK
jgi:ATP-dependent helicase/nuclease subunit B